MVNLLMSKTIRNIDQYLWLNNRVPLIYAPGTTVITDCSQYIMYVLLHIQILLYGIDNTIPWGQVMYLIGIGVLDGLYIYDN